MVVLFVLSFLLAAGNGAIFALLPQIQEAADLPDWSLGVVVVVTAYRAVSVVLAPPPW